jgi:hypothetical protein
MHTAQPKGGERSPLSKWLAYSGSVAAFMAVAPKTNAQVIYTDVDPDEVIDASAFDIDFDGDGTIDVHFLQSGITFSGYVIDLDLAQIPDGNAVVGTNGSSTNTNTGYPSVVASGQVIGAEVSNFQGQSSQLLALGVNGAVPSSVSYGQWGGQSGFLGVRFSIDGETHYGWIQLEVSAGGETITVKDYAYESTPDMAINAGDEGSATTGVAQLATPVKIGVFPNPARDLATVDFSGLQGGTAELSVINGIGQVMQTRQVAVTEGSNRLDLHLGSLPAGSYFVRLRNADHVAFQKVSRVD